MWKRSLIKASKPLTKKKGLIKPPPSSTSFNHTLLSRQKQVGETTAPRKPNAVENALFGNRTKVAAEVANPRVIFPWRHKEYPLPRLIPGSEEHVLEGGEFGPRMPFIPMKWGVTCLAGSYIGVPWYQVALPGWRQDLADSSSWAFSQAVAGVMSNLYHVPFDDIRQEDGDFSVDLKHTIVTSASEETTEDEDNEEEEESALDDMIEEKLRALYQSAHECGRDQLQIHLQMEPTSSHLVGMFVVPWVTREDVKQDPSLQNTFQNMYLRQQEEEVRQGRELSMADTATFVFDEFKELAGERVKIYDDHASLSLTAIAQVVVNCDEVFSVTDLTTGKVLQGHEDGQIRNVPHVVRLEAVVDVTKEYGSKRTVTEVGPWQITDWDDLLEGNIWFL